MPWQYWLHWIKYIAIHKKIIDVFEKKQALSFRAFLIKKPARSGLYGGQGGIRTHGRLPPTTVFKTVALNRTRPPVHKG